ncbi:MAG: hypothetical protein ACLGGX_08375 [Bdellovibrionia bacterium]
MRLTRLLITSLAIFSGHIGALAQSAVEVCSPERASELRQYENEGVILIDSWLQTFKNKYGVEVAQIRKQRHQSEFKAKNQLELATSVLLCTQEKLRKGLVYLCADNLAGDVAWTLPVISRRVFLDHDKFWNTAVDYKRAVVIHEATHKCGTNDAIYYKKGTNPHNVGFVGWSTIADTYSYWAYYRLCIPGIDCN